MNIATLPRVRFASLPTPLQELPNLGKYLNGPRIFIKRDDLTGGLAMGGNKTRKLEFLMGQAQKEGADYIVTGGGHQSNWCTQAAAAARRMGMKTLLLKTAPSADYVPSDYDGNHLLHVLMGAEIRYIRPEDEAQAQQEAMAELTAAGHKPHLLPAAGSTPLGCAGYMNAMLEMTNQAVDMGIDIDYIVHASGSGGTQAGLLLGAKAMNLHTKIVCSTTGSRNKAEQIENVFNIVAASERFFGLDLGLTRDDVTVHDQYAGEGYGFITEGKAEAIKILAETEGIFVDPVYTGSAAACLIDLVRNNYFKRGSLVVLLHTGGSPALYPYKEPLKSYLDGKGLSWNMPSWSPKAGI